MPRKGAKEDEECFAEPAPQISFCELEKSMTAFSGDDAYGVDIFIKDFEDIANLMQWTGIEKVIYAKRLLKGTAKLFLRSLTGTTTWELLKTGLKEEFGLHLNSAAIHKTISNRKMKPGETYQQYFLQLKELAVLGNIEDDALMEYIIDGIPDNEMNKTILYGASNIKEFRKKLDLYAEIKKKCRTSNKAYNQSTTSKPTTSGWKKPLPKKRCFNCGDLDHESSGCSKGIKCFRCNDFGHKSTGCPKNIKKTLEIKCNKKNDSQAPYKEVMINNVMVKSLIDTGSDVNLMNESTFTQIHGDTCNYHPDLVQSLTGIGDCEVHTRGSCTPRIEIDGCQCEATFYIIEDDKIPVDVIIGNPILQDIELSFKSGVISAKRILQVTMLEDQAEEPMIIGNFKYKDQIEKILTEYDPGKCCKESKVELKVLEKEHYDDFMIEAGILWKIKDGKKLMVVPKKMQNEIIRKNHDKGHFGLIKTEELISRNYYFENMKDKIKSVLENCIECILISHKKGKSEGFLHAIDKGDIPLSTYHIDHLGPLTSTNKNYKYILTVVDGFTKFTWIYPTKTLSTDEVIDKLKIQQQTFGSPQRIISDRSTSFTSNTFKEFCETEGILHHIITTGQPRGNGQVERVYQIIIDALSKLSADDPTKWYKHISNIQRCLNGSFQRSIKMSPFELLTGVKINNKNEAIYNLINEENLKIFCDEREDLRKKARENIQKIQDENRRNFNRRRRKPREYEVGNLVAIKRTQFVQGYKLHPRYLGPYEVVKKKRNDRYDLQRIGQGEGPHHTSSSADMMKPWVADAVEYESSGADD